MDMVVTDHKQLRLFTETAGTLLYIYLSLGCCVLRIFWGLYIFVVEQFSPFDVVAIFFSRDLFLSFGLYSEHCMIVLSFLVYTVLFYMSFLCLSSYQHPIEDISPMPQRTKHEKITYPVFHENRIQPFFISDSSMMTAEATESRILWFLLVMISLISKTLQMFILTIAR